MKKSLLSIAVLVLFLLCTITVVGAQTAPEVVTKAFNVRPGGLLTLNSELGTIDVKTTNRNRVDVVFTKSLKSGSNIKIGGLTRLEVDRLVREAFADFEATFEQKGSNVLIEGNLKRGWQYWLRRSQHISLLLISKVKIEFQVTVPRLYNLNLTVADSGDIHVVTSVGGEVIAETGYGDIQLGSVTGSVNAKTGGSGTITLKGCQSEVDAITGYGDIRSDLTRQLRRRWTLETSGSGEIVVALIPAIAIDIDALSGSGHVSSDFPVRGNESKNRLKGTINGGGPLLRLRTSYGDIRLLRKSR